MSTSDRTDPPEPTLSREEITSRAGRGILLLGLRGLLTRLFALAGNVVLARLLLPADFGALAFGFTIIALAAVLSSAGLGAALVRRSKPPTHHDLEALFGFQLSVYVVLTLLIAVVGLNTGRAGLLAAIMASALPVDALRIPGAIVAERALRFGVIARAEILEILAYNVFAIGSVVLGAGVWGVAAAAIVRAVVGSAVMVKSSGVGVLRPRWSGQFVRENARFGFTFQSVSIVALMRDQGLNLIVAAVAGLTTLGYWSIASRLQQAITLLFESLWRVSYPTMARLIQAKEDVTGTLRNGLSLAGFLAGTVTVILGGCAPALIPALFGPNWDPSIGILPGTAIGALIVGPISACTAGYLSAIGEVRTVLYGAIVLTTALLGCAAIALQFTGPEAIGYAFAFASAAQAVFLAVNLRRQAGIRPARALAPTTIAAILAMGAAHVVAVQIDAPWPALILSGLTGEVVYLGLSLLVARDAVLRTWRLVVRTVAELQRRAAPAAT